MRCDGETGVFPDPSLPKWELVSWRRVPGSEVILSLWQRRNGLKVAAFLAGLVVTALVNAPELAVGSTVDLALDFFEEVAL